MTSRRKLAARTWIFGSVAYGVVRATLVWRYLSHYGVSTSVFSTIEITSSLVFGWMSSYFVLAIIDGKWKRAILSLAPTLLAYGAPDVYVFVAVGQLPEKTWRILVFFIAASIFITLAGITRKIIQGQDNQRSGQKELIRTRPVARQSRNGGR